MSSSSADALRAAVAAKFAGGERVVALLARAALVGPDWMRQRERVLALVERERGGARALFALLPRSAAPRSFLELSVERALPCDAELRCTIDGGEGEAAAAGAGGGDGRIYLAVSRRRCKFSFELRPGADAAAFVDELMRSAEVQAPISTDDDPHRFAWLQKYTGGTGGNPTSNNPKKLTDEDDQSTAAAAANMESSPIEMFIARPSALDAGGVVAPTARDSLIKYHTELKEHEYAFAKPFDVFVGTWNVNGQPPPATLKRWLSSEATPPDVYALGFQELDLSKEALLFDLNASRQLEADWCDTIMRSLDPRTEYARVCVTRLVGMMLVVLVRREHAKHVDNLAFDTVGTGLMGKLGNKGGVSVRFDLHGTSMCFVNCHLAAHVEEYARRNQDYLEICNRTQFASAKTPGAVKCIKDHNQIYWLGDLNYRITEMDHLTVKRHLDEGNIAAVLVADQLKIQYDANKVLQGYAEGPITFRPTYKYNPGTDQWDSSEKERAPAWCDRILWRGDAIKQVSYQSYPELNISDHKPVSALFVADVKVIDAAKYKKVHEEVIKKLDKYENEFLPHVTVEPTEVVFDTIKYLEPQAQELCIANTGQVPVKFEFIKKLEEASFCKEWLSVEPSVKKILPGEKCDVKLTVYVSEKSAFKLNSGEDKLYDILVLHLDGGKDIFITVNGAYEKSCFGASIETLAHLKAPVRDVLARKLVDPTDAGDRDGLYYRKEAYAVPKELWHLVDRLHRDGLRQPNLFRYRGLQSEVWAIREWLDRDPLDEAEMPGGVHSCVDALVRFLQSTPEPLIPFNHHYACYSASNNYVQCKQIVHLLPEYKRNVFLYLCAFLQEVLGRQAENGTDVKLLAVIFSAIFLREPPQYSCKSASDRRSIDIKKRIFVEHFLVNDLSDLLRTCFVGGGVVDS